MDVEDASRDQLPLLYSNRFAQATETKLAEYCDIHDLIAVVLKETQKVQVYRINGQVAFTIDRKDESCKVEALKWKPDGSLLGVGWSDGVCGIYSGEDGKVLSLSAVYGAEEGGVWSAKLERTDVSHEDVVEAGRGVCCIGWTSYDLEDKRSTRLSKTTEDGVTTDDWPAHINGGLSSNSNNEATNGTALAKLTKSIATIDATKPLPLLSALPSHALRFQREDQKFTTQAGLSESREQGSESNLLIRVKMLY